MKELLENVLLKKYPEIFKINSPKKNPFDFWVFEPWDGWAELINNAAFKIQKILDNDPEAYFHTAQLKSKFAALRWDSDHDEKHHEEYEKIISDAEDESLKTCEKCGTKDSVTTNDIRSGYMFTLCYSCREKQNSEIKNIDG